MRKVLDDCHEAQQHIEAFLNKARKDGNMTKQKQDLAQGRTSGVEGKLGRIPSPNDNDTLRSWGVATNA